MISIRTLHFCVSYVHATAYSVAGADYEIWVEIPFLTGNSVE
ncbi:hypothetical protein CLV36_103126 [Laceyella sediminis]|uniref:Uncharacterized protein n=1 Tax=Laceyella sediminis TaxID=573074 RepID=A0ABX5EUB2_9BACL|nr:hypothetical protein CLV36_103126 [Laceyella sediminis]